MYQKLKLSKMRLKKKVRLFIWILVLSSCLFLVKEAPPESVKFILSSEKKPETLFLFPGRVSLLNLPCAITKAIIGSPNDIKAEIDKLSPADAHILLKKWSSKPSNLILKCSDQVFLFNLIPSRNSHYDYIKVLSHIKTIEPLKIKSALPNTPSKTIEGLRKGQDFIIRKVLDFSWESK